MSKLDILRKLIREEVRAGIQEELAQILKETLLERREPPKTEGFRESLKPKFTPKPAPQVKVPQLSEGNPLAKLLKETAADLQAAFEEDYAVQERPQEAGTTVEDMLGSAKVASSLEHIEISEVPDFTGLMSKLKEKGTL